MPEGTGDQVVLLSLASVYVFGKSFPQMKPNVGGKITVPPKLYEENVVLS